MGLCETVKVKHPTLGFIIINKSDFNPHVHEEHVETGEKRTVGPTFDEWLEMGELPWTYPPAGWPPIRSAAWDKWCEQKSLAPKNADGLNLDGPTFEVWIGDEQTPESYPPAGYAAIDSPGWLEYQKSKLQIGSGIASDGESEGADISKLNLEGAAKLIAAANTLEELDTLELAERDARGDGARKGVLDRLEKRREEVKAALQG